MPALRQLEAEFIKLTPDGSGAFHRQGDQLAGADGLWFLCPLCFRENLAKHGDGTYGTHHVLCWFLHVDPKHDPKPGRWQPAGTGLDDLTFVPSPGRSPSVALRSGCRWHGFVTAGSAD